MTVADLIPQLDDAELTNLHANALRLQDEQNRRGEEAAALIPLIEAELALRSERAAASKPSRPAPKRRAKAQADKAQADEVQVE